MDAPSYPSDALPVLVTPGALQVARALYRESCELHPPRAQTIRGITVDANTYRAHVVRAAYPILLPWELYVPVSELQRGADPEVSARDDSDSEAPTFDPALPET